jgi:hypothetical protein
VPILLRDDKFNEYPPAPADPTVVARFGTGDTRVQRVWVSANGDAGPVELRVYAANPIPPGTVVGKDSPDAASGRPAIVLAFPDAASARLVLDYWRASLDAPRHAVPPAVRDDPRYTLQADPAPRKTAVERAQELMKVLGRDLPPKALLACNFLARKYDSSGEIMLAVFAGYAQVCEGLPCDDPAYAASPELRAYLEGAK